MTPAASRGRLLQVLGVAFGLAISIGNTIAAGIVRTPGEIATYLPTPWLFISVWLVGGLYAILGSNSIAELGTAIPESGGQYVFAKRAIGPYAGFIVGWSDWMSTCGTNAAVSIVIGEYSSQLLARFLPGEQKQWEVPIATLIVLAFAVLNWRGIRRGSAAQNFTSLLKALIFLVIVAACFIFGSRHTVIAGAAGAAAPAGKALFIAFVLALQSVMYTYDGWTGPIYFSEEVKNPGKNIPRAMFGGALGIIGIYVFFNLALLYILPMSKIQGENFAMGAAASAIFGPVGDTIARSLMVLALLSGINAYVLMTSRVLFAMSRDGLFSHRAEVVNEGGTPTLALALSTAVALAFLWSGTFTQVINICAFFFVANYTISFTSVFVLRHREPNLPRPFRAWGHPWTTGLVLLGSVAYLSGVVLSDKKTSTISIVLLALSYPAFRLMRLPRK
ncbi:MAG TPA: APC family permease [Candidatus Acidoferrales bacterium]|nr:APC family permease [Candidatus Acidoferrales bacterium]